MSQEEQVHDLEENKLSWTELFKKKSQPPLDEPSFPSKHCGKCLVQ